MLSTEGGNIQGGPGPGSLGLRACGDLSGRRGPVCTVGACGVGSVGSPTQPAALVPRGGREGGAEKPQILPGGAPGSSPGAGSSQLRVPGGHSISGFSSCAPNTCLAVRYTVSAEGPTGVPASCGRAGVGRGRAAHPHPQRECSGPRCPGLCSSCWHSSASSHALANKGAF